MTFNAKCTACGSSGYQGLVSFECSKSGCVNYVTTVSVQPTVTVQPSSFFSGGITTGQVSGTAGYRQTAIPDWMLQMRVGLKFLNLLHDGAQGHEPLQGNAGMIAGGAPRDWFFGKRAKDIDIYVEFFNPYDFKKAFPLLSLTTKSSTALSYGAAFGVWDVSYDGEAFQIISLKQSQTIESHVDSFDFGINKIMVDRTGKTIETPAFSTDIARQTLTCEIAKLDVTTFPNFGKRVALMKSKFPGWTIDIV